MSRSSGTLIELFGRAVADDARGVPTSFPNEWQRDRIVMAWNGNGRGRVPAVYSYGRHFPLCEVLPKGFHGRRRPVLLLNADRWSVTTSRHQNEARSMAARLASEISADVLLLPFETLTAAGIDRATVRPLEVRPDRTVTLETIPVPIDFGAPETADSARPFEDWNGAGTVFTWHVDGSRFTRERLEREKVPGTYVDGRWQAPESEWRELAAPSWRAPTVAAAPAGDGWTELAENDAGGYEIRRRRHFLGDSLFTARARGRRRKFLSSFDANERTPLYFLAELPRTPASTVAAAVDSLAPPAVHAAIAQGRDVKRQGDIFYIPVDLNDAAIYGRARTRARLSLWTHMAAPRAGEIGFIDRQTRRARIAAEYRSLRRPFARSAHQKRRPGSLTAEEYRELWNVPNAYEAKYGRRARELEQRAYRAENGTPAFIGESYARELERERLRGPIHQETAGAAYATARARVDARDFGAIRAALAVYGTAHTATEVVTARNGAAYVRGIVRHVPAVAGENRQRDHANVKLGDTWHLAIRNTVPRLDGRRAGAV